MNVIGIMRIKNESQWIARCISSILPVCNQVIVLDDHSTDSTPDICRNLHEKVQYHLSPFTGLNEVRDKNWLLEKAVEEKADWIVSIDGDEMLEASGVEKLMVEMREATVPCLSLRVLYLWGNENNVRVDGVYGDFHRESVFRPEAKHKFLSTSAGGNFHCGNVPVGVRGKRKVLEVPLLHFGYMERATRVKKLDFYTSVDWKNTTEDWYRHITQGDDVRLEELPRVQGLVEKGVLDVSDVAYITDVPKELRLVHAGPLAVRALSEMGKP